MAARSRIPQPRKEEAGRPDYHDPFAGIGGAEPALSALTLRLWLASLGVLMCGAAAGAIAASGGPAVAVAIFVIAAVIGVIDLVVVIRRKRRGEPG
jgi:Flp pilus assembly protein TadB